MTQVNYAFERRRVKTTRFGEQTFADYTENEEGRSFGYLIDRLHQERMPNLSAADIERRLAQHGGFVGEWVLPEGRLARIIVHAVA